MRGKKLPNILRNPSDHSITLWHNRPKYSLLWLHGIGDHPDSFLPFFTHLQSPLYQHLRIKLLQAPTRTLSITQQPTLAWFDLKSTNRFSIPQEKVYELDQVRQTTHLIRAYCLEEEQFWTEEDPTSKVEPQHRVFVGGFSQGAVAALYYALSHEFAPAGVISASGYLLQCCSLANLGKVPILLLHGDKDNVVGQSEAKASLSGLMEKEWMVDYHKFQGLGHEMNIKQLVTIGSWIKDRWQFIAKHYGESVPTDI